MALCVTRCRICFDELPAACFSISLNSLFLSVQEGDVLDAELDEEETEIARSGELFGEQLLSAKYLGVSF